MLLTTTRISAMMIFFMIAVVFVKAAPKYSPFQHRAGKAEHKERIGLAFLYSDSVVPIKKRTAFKLAVPPKQRGTLYLQRLIFSTLFYYVIKYA
jgi:hypothetical protein